MTPKCAQITLRMMLIMLSLTVAHNLLGGGAHKPQPAAVDYRFIENKGQWGKQILFKADIDQGAMFLERGGFVYHLKERAYLKAHHDGNAQASNQINEKVTSNAHAFKLGFKGAILTPEVMGEHPTEEYYNYFTGNDRARWVGRASAFTKINYNGLYPGVDLDVYAQGKQLKYDFVVKAKADANQIRLNYEGAEKVYLENGQLVIITSVATMREKCPIAYQIIQQRKVQVACNFALNNNEVTFNFPKGYNHDYDLVIDPELIFSTYSGSRADNFGYTATFDVEGFLYSGSSVFGVGYPLTLGAYQEKFTGGKNFVGEKDFGVDFAITKYDTTGTKLIYSTLIGGYGPELPHSIIANAQGELYIYGTTGSKNFPMVNPIQSKFGGGVEVSFPNMGAYYPEGSDMFVCKLNADGSDLLQSTYIGGSNNDGINSLGTQATSFDGINIFCPLTYNYADELRGEIDIDSEGSVYITSCTASSDFPTSSGSLQPVFGGGGLDGCIVKFNSEISQVTWSTYLGGKGSDALYSIDFDSANQAYVAGGTTSLNLPVQSTSVQRTSNLGRSDGYVAKISAAGTAVTASTYWGNTFYDQIYFVELDFRGDVYVFGQTENSQSYFIRNADYSVKNSGQFISKFSGNLSSVLWSTSFGTPEGVPNISPTAFLVDVCNKVYLSGWGGGNNMTLKARLGNKSERANKASSTFGLTTTSDAFQKTTDSSDFYLMVMEYDASKIYYATFFGGNVSGEHVDGGTSRFDRKGKIYQSVCAGCGSSTLIPNSDFPIFPNPGAWSPLNGNKNCNNAVFKFNFDMPIVISEFKYSGCNPIVFKNLSLEQKASTFLWQFGDGNTSTERNPTHNYERPGKYKVTLVVKDQVTCNLIDSVSRTVYISPLIEGVSASANPQTIYKNQTTTLTAFPNSNAYNYQWMPAEVVKSPKEPTTSAKPLDTTVFQVDITDKINNCTYSARVAVNVIPSDIDMPIEISEFKYSGCNPIIFQNLSSEQKASTFLWQFGDGNTSTERNPTHNYARPGQYKVTLVLKDQVTGNLIDSVSRTVYISPLIEGVSASANPTSIYKNQTTTLAALPNSTIYNYQWIPAGVVTSPKKPTTSAKPMDTTIFQVDITDKINNCTYSAKVAVNVIPIVCGKPDVFVPNAFTPNEDNENDVLRVEGNNIMTINFSIYDRWGERVFESQDQKNGWDGTYKGRKLDPDVYVYHLKGVCLDEEPFEYKGNITLIR